jgi:hypothetical protein
VSQHHLTFSHLRDSFFDRISRYESVYHDLNTKKKRDTETRTSETTLGFLAFRLYLVGLTDTMSTRERLDVVVRIPIRIVDDDGIGCRQIDTQTSGPVNYDSR